MFFGWMGEQGFSSVGWVWVSAGADTHTAMAVVANTVSVTVVNRDAVAHRSARWGFISGVEKIVGEEKK